MKANKIFLLVLALLLCITASAFAGETGAVDYSAAQHWLALAAAADKPVDVFFLYPTVYQKADKNAPNICDIDNPVMLKNSQMALKFQASAFETVGNLYAPYYRQADAAYALNLPPPEQDRVIGGIPSSDAAAAFDCYIRHYNRGRPFILAGHSQGSNVLLYLLSGYLKEHPEIYEKMIAAYVIGYSVTGDYLAKNPHLRFARGPADTGVIVSYNTEAPNMTGRNPVLLPGALAINPISWTRGEELASADQNLGSVDADQNGNIIRLEHYADARVNLARGAVICGSVDENKLSPGNQVFPKGVYHHYDYLFYYYNLRANAAVRADSFLRRP